MKSRTDSFLVVATIAFAFLAASFAAANSDLWLHLATGRLIANGGYTVGVDPFSFFAVRWINHSWLFDLGFFELFRIGGGSALVVAKAAAAAFLAVVILRLARRGNGPVWLATGSTLLAVLAMSPRLLLQPQCLSLLLFAACLALLVEGGRAVRWVPPLIALWVNLDSWFILGPCLAIIFALTMRQPRWFVPAAIAACLLNPHHIHAFALPPELNPEVWNYFAGYPRYAAFFASPWRMTGPASWAFPVLLGLGVLSFLLNPRAIRGWRLATWLPLAALAAWQARLVPFFAVAAGPILAMNLGEAFGPTRFLKWGRTAIALAAVCLLVLAWPGWLQSFHARDRALAWRLAPDPSLAHAAERIRERNVNAVNHESLDVAHYVDWFAPGVKTRRDSRLQLFTGERKMRLPPCAILHPNDLPEGAAVVEVAGSVVITDEQEPAFKPDRLAFAPPTALVPETAALPEPADWWNLAAHRLAPRTWEGEAAPTYLRLFELQPVREKSPALTLLAIRSARTSLAAEPRGDDVWVALARGYLFQSRFSWEATASAEFELLKELRHVQAVGALQQAVLANPDNAAAHEGLANAFTERGFTDLALHHRREQLRLAKRGPANDTVAKLQEAITGLEGAVFEAENRWRVHTDALAGNPFERARAARDLGLAFTAIDTLLKSHFELYGVDGLRLLLDLFLQTGRLLDARTLLDRDELVRSPAALGLFRLPAGGKGVPPREYAMPAYSWFDFCQSAAAGRYEAAGQALERLLELLLAIEQYEMRSHNAVLFELAMQGFGATGVARQTALGFAQGRLGVEIGRTRFRTAARGDLHVLAGVLDLERGAVREAESDFVKALETYSQWSGPVARHPGRPLAVRYRDALRQP